MSALIQKNKKQLLIIIIFLLMLPIILHLQELILTFGQITGTALRMYIEGVCVK